MGINKQKRGVEGGPFRRGILGRAEPPGDRELHPDWIHLGRARLFQKSYCREVQLVLSDSSIH